ncbi:MAG: DNA polymerase III subunit epsilon [Rudaea sp.]
MRQIVLDTETTGLEVAKGHRIIEIGCIELSERRPTGRKFHRYLNPQRRVDEGALAVHGIDNDFLADKPRFSEIVAEFLAFIEGAELIIHNAAFDVAFLDAELSLADAALGRIVEHAQVLDTLLLARQKYPGQKNNLDALCRRLNVDNRHRDLHGALLDAQLLAEVYLGMTGGQGDLGLATAVAPDTSITHGPVTIDQRPPLRVHRADPMELSLHDQGMQRLEKASKGRCLWLHAEQTNHSGATAV